MMSHNKSGERRADIGRSAPLVPAQRPKVVLERKVRPHEPAGHAVKVAFKGAVERISDCDPVARRGDSEGIHRLRTSTRRLRSELRAFRDLVEPKWRAPLEKELKWLADLLGAVRDLDVLRARLQKATANELGDEAEALAPLFRSFTERHETAAQALDTGLQGPRYRHLVAVLEEAIGQPQLTDEACEPCRSVLPALAGAAWRRFKKGARAVRLSDPDSEFHELRKRAKRARYIAELIAPIIGSAKDPSANRFIRLIIQVQDTLGEHQDAVVASAEIERCVAENPRDRQLVDAASRLLATQREAARGSKTSFFKVWDKLDRKKSTRWLKTRSKARA
jgi:CHAD domain-containing protein